MRSNVIFLFQSHLLIIKINKLVIQSKLKITNNI